MIKQIIKINYHKLLTKKIENKIYQSSCHKHSKIDHHMSNNANQILQVQERLVRNYFYKWINARGLIFSLKAEGIQKHCLRPIVNKM